MTPLIQLNNVSKRFGRIQANDSISLTVEAGEIRGLVGGNGAGKSTLMKILYGLCQPDEGEILLRGEQARIQRPMDAIKLGMGMVQQDFHLVENMDAVENIIIGAEVHQYGIIDYKEAEKQIREMANRFRLECDLNRHVSELSVGSRQRLELLKLLFRKASIIILDEPTGPLVPHEVDALFDIMHRLKKSGVTIIFVSHKLREVLEICDNISVLRDGRLVVTEEKKNVTIDKLVEWMTGGSIPPLKRAVPHPEKKAAIELRNVSVRENDRRVLSDVSFTVRSGEILGIVGVEGNGQRELEEALVGLRKITSGTISINGKQLDRVTPAAVLQQGLGYIPSHRQLYGMIGGFSLADNLILGHHSSSDFTRYGLLRRQAIDRNANRGLNVFRVEPTESHLEAQWLSGGNQQKLVVAKVMFRKPSSLVASHPTRGVSIHDANFIWQKLLDMKAAGGAVLLITADLTELFILSDEIAVIFEGRIVAHVNPDEVSPVELNSLLIGAQQ